MTEDTITKVRRLCESQVRMRTYHPDGAFARKILDLLDAEPPEEPATWNGHPLSCAREFALECLRHNGHPCAGCIPPALREKYREDARRGLARSEPDFVPQPRLPVKGTWINLGTPPHGTTFETFARRIVDDPEAKGERFTPWHTPLPDGQRYETDAEFGERIKRTMADAATDEALAEVKAADPEGTAPERIVDEEDFIRWGRAAINFRKELLTSEHAAVVATPTASDQYLGLAVPGHVHDNPRPVEKGAPADCPKRFGGCCRTHEPIVAGTLCPCTECFAARGGEEKPWPFGCVEPPRASTVVPSAPPIREDEIFKIDPPIQPRADGSVKFNVTINMDEPPPKPCPQCGSFECAGPEDSDTCEFEAAGIADEPFELDEGEEPPY